MTGYRLLVTLHVLSAFWLTSSAFGGAVVRAMAKRATDLPAKVTAIRISARLGQVFGLPGSLAAGLTGLTLVAWNRPLFDLPKAGWIHASITLWVLILGMNLFYLIPRGKKMLAAAEASLAAGAPTAEMKALASNKMAARLSDLTAVAVVLFVVLMVLRPF